MKLQQHTNVNEVIGVQKQHKFKITDGSQAIIMDSLINLYSDPIGSIVREITSNCIDANRERNLKLEGKIPTETEDDKSFWSKKQTVCIEYVEKNTILGIDECIMFHDYGCGLSQDRVANVFTTFGASTKRDNNYEIGGFGLGAKSPLAYSDTFYVSSRHNGTETYYMIYRNNDNVPHMDQVYQASTDQQNGSTVIVPIKDSYDRRSFKESIATQLCFFDNLVFKNVVESIGKVNNYYTSGDSSYKVTEETDDYIITNDGREPFLLVGKVVYPLNWNMLDDFTESDFRGSVGIKFNIGVLDLVPSREELRYTSKTISLIQDKLKSVLGQFKQQINKKYENITDFGEYLRVISVLGQGHSTWRRMTSDDPNAVKSDIAGVGYYDVPFVPFPKLSCDKNTNDTGAFHKVFDGISFYHCKLVSNKGAIGGETIYKRECNSWYDLFSALNDKTNFYYVDSNFSKNKDYTLINSVGEFVAFKVDAVKIGERTLDTKLNLNDPRPSYEKTATFNTVCRLLGKSSSMIKYSDVEETELDSELMGDVVDNKTRRKVNKMVFARNAEFKADGYETTIKYTNQEYKISDLQVMLHPEEGDPKLKAVVYAETKDLDELEKVVKVLGSSRDFYKNNYNYSYKFDSYYRVLKVSKDVAKQFANLDGFITAHEFMKDSTHLQRFATAQYIGKYIEKIRFLNYFEPYDKDLNSKFYSLNTFYKGNTNGCWRCEDDIQPVVEEIMKLDIPDTVRYDMELVDKLEEVVEYSQGLDLLNYVEFSSNSRKSIEDFLSLKGKMPDNQQIKLTLTAKNQKDELLSS